MQECCGCNLAKRLRAAVKEHKSSSSYPILQSRLRVKTGCLPSLACVANTNCVLYNATTMKDSYLSLTLDTYVLSHIILLPATCYLLAADVFNARRLHHRVCGNIAHTATASSQQGKAHYYNLAKHNSYSLCMVAPCEGSIPVGQQTLSCKCIRLHYRTLFSLTDSSKLRMHCTQFFSHLI